jgi:hypothetical protein
MTTSLPSTTATFETHSLTIELPLDVAEQLAQTHENGLEGAAVAALQLWLKIGEKHLGIAKGYALAHGMSQHAAIKKAIAKVLDEKAPRVETTAPLKQHREARDADVYRRAMLGIKRKTLAQDYGLSEIRIHQIIAKYRKTDPKNSPEQKARDAELRREWSEGEL